MRKVCVIGVCATALAVFGCTLTSTPVECWQKFPSEVQIAVVARAESVRDSTQEQERTKSPDLLIPGWPYGFGRSSSTVFRV